MPNENTVSQSNISRSALVAQLCEMELAGINRRYGSNRGPGLDWLLYHNETHSRHVRDTAKSLARELAQRGMIDIQDVDLVEFAGAFHDHEQGLGSGANERASADAALRALRQHPEHFSERDMQCVESMILGTTVSIEDGSMHQAAGSTDLLQACVADADLSALAERDGLVTGLRLFCEGEIKAGRMQLPRSIRQLESMTADPRALNGFLKFQENLVQRHHYLLDISEARYRDGIDRNAEATAKLLARQELGASFADLYNAPLGLTNGPSAGIGIGISPAGAR